MAYYLRNFFIGCLYFSAWFFIFRPIFSERHPDFANDITIRLAISTFVFVFAKAVVDRLINTLLGRTVIIYNTVLGVVFWLFVYCLSIFFIPLILLMWCYQFWQLKHKAVEVTDITK